MEVNLEKEQLSKVIDYMKKVIEENKKIYKELSEVYVGDLRQAKRLANKIFDDVQINYSSEKNDIYLQAGTMHGNINVAQQTINNLLNELSQWLKEQEAKLKYLENQKNLMK